MLFVIDLIIGVVAFVAMAPMIVYLLRGFLTLLEKVGGLMLKPLQVTNRYVLWVLFGGSLLGGVIWLAHLLR